MSKHSDKFYKTRYKSIINYAESRGIENPYNSWRDFKSDYEEVASTGTKQVMRTMQYNLQYDMNYKASLAAYKAVNEGKGKNAKDRVKLKDIQSMTTVEFAEMYKDSIMSMYRQKMREGQSAKQAGEFISNFWFGSE